MKMKTTFIRAVRPLLSGSRSSSRCWETWVISRRREVTDNSPRVSIRLSWLPTDGGDPFVKVKRLIN